MLYEKEIGYWFAYGMYGLFCVYGVRYGGCCIGDGGDGGEDYGDR